MEERTQLTALDVRVMNSHVCHAFFFRGRLDVSSMQRNLNEVAREIPDIAGRIVREGESYYILKNSAGFKFLVEDNNSSLDSIDKFCVYRYGEPLAKNTVNENESIFNVKITRFRDGDLLCVNRSHALCDGAGLFGVLSRWARLCRGDSKLPPMNLDRKPLLDLQEGEDGPNPGLSENRSSGEVRKKIKYAQKKIRVVLSEFRKLKEVLLSEAVSSTSWVSTRDIVMAVLLKELSFSKDPEGEVCVTTVINFRKNGELGVGADYFGNAISSRKTIYKVSDLRRDDLLSVSRRYRDSSEGGRSLAAITETMNYRDGLSKLADTMLFANDVSRFALQELNFGSGFPYMYEIAPALDGDYESSGPTINSILMLPENPGNENYLPVWIGLPESEMELFLKRVSNGRLFML